MFVPGGSTTDRFWDQYEPETQGKSSRPRSMSDASIEVDTKAGRFVISFEARDGRPSCVTVLAQANSCVNYEA